jgi:radical SAM superfamily enzyme with C-terminal helix-hairpin-helix motif
MEDEFYDLVYDAWRQGKNPDLVSEESYDDMRSQGYYPDEISVKDVYPKHNNGINSDRESRCACADNQGGPCSFCMEEKFNL